MIETSVIFAFLAMLFWGFGDFFIQRTTRKIGSVSTLFAIGFIGSIVLLPFVWGDLKLIDTIEMSIILFVLGILTFLIAIIDFEALKKGKLSVIEVVLEIELPITVILAFIFLREDFSLWLLLLFAVVFLGLIFVSIPTLKFNHIFRNLEKGVMLALIAGIGFGLINFLTGYVAINLTPLLAVWVAWAIFTVLTFVFIIKKHGFMHAQDAFKKADFWVLIMGLLDTGAWVFYAFAIVGSGLSIATGITESYPAVALLLGVLVNKEKIKPHQYIGAVVVLIASVIIGVYFG